MLLPLGYALVFEQCVRVSLDRVRPAALLCPEPSISSSALTFGGTSASRDASPQDAAARGPRRRKRHQVHSADGLAPRRAAARAARAQRHVQVRSGAGELLSASAAEARYDIVCVCLEYCCVRDCERRVRFWLGYYYK